MKIKKLIIPGILVLCIALLAMYQHHINRTIWNDSYVNGNTASNLYNSGLFCEHNGTVYFSNPNDNHSLYSMTIDGNNVTKLCDDIVSFINADDNYVYFVRNNLSGNGEKFSFLHLNSNSLCRYDLKTGKIKVLDDAPSLYASLVGNYVYYIHYDKESASSLYQVKIDGSEKKQIDKNPYFTCSANGPYLYYNGLESDHNIYQMDTSTGTSNLLYEGNFWMPVVNNSNIFFMDCDANYALASLNLTAEKHALLTNDRIDCFNVYGDYIYFQRNGENGDAALCRMKTDGSDYQVIQTGNYTNINVTSRYVYFNEFGNDDVVFQMPTGKDTTVEVFTP